MDLLNLAELEARARARLDPLAWDYFASGADDERCLARSRDAYARHPLHPRVLVDVRRRALATTALGQPLAAPLGVAPMAFQRLAHPDGELAAVRAAGAAGVPYVLSTLATTAVEDVVAAATAPVWLQLYVLRDRGATHALIARAEAAGCRALVITVDAPALGRRERDVKNQFALPAGLTVPNVPIGPGAPAAGSALTRYFAEQIDPGLTWPDLDALAARTRLPIVVKGVLRADDAARAADHGAAAIWVSNHGGRQLDAAPAPIDVLARVVDAVDGRAEVFLDGGVRRGTDVVTALALGARCVLVGRPILWGLAVDGEAGATAALAALIRELDLAMALCGAPAIAAITRDLVEPVP